MALRSMTGYGRAGRFAHGVEIGVQARSVNHKGADLKVSVPGWLLELEQTIALAARKRLQRGRINISLTVQIPDSASAASVFNLPAIERYKVQLEELAAHLGIDEPVSLAQILDMRGLYREVEEAVRPEDLADDVIELVDEAIDRLIAERDREGAALAEDFLERVAIIARNVATIEAELPVARQAFFDRLRERVDDLTARHKVETISDDRLAQEVILYADRSDIAEELTRARAHLRAVQKLVESHDPEQGPVGKKLDFYFQEMIRETNTMGSKSQSATIATCVVEIRCEIERLREQVLNVE